MIKLTLKCLAAISGAVTIVDIVGSPAIVQGSSMEPTLNPSGSNINDLVWLNRFAAKTGAVERGDIVTIYCPTESNEMHIKRVVGLPGDYIFSPSSGPTAIQIPQGHCWVEGDNRSLMVSSAGSSRKTWISKDSNVYGPVSLGLIDARVSWVIFPFHRFRRLKRTTEPSRYLLKGKHKDMAESLLAAAASS